MLRSDLGGLWVQHAEEEVWPGNRAKQEQQPGALHVLQIELRPGRPRTNDRDDMGSAIQWWK